MPAVAAPPAPTTATPAPAPKDAPEPMQQPEIGTPTTKTDFMADVEADLEAMSAADDAPAKPAVKPPDAKPDTEVKPPDKGTEPKQDTTPKEPEPPKRAKELREAYDGLKTRVSTELEPKIKNLEAKIREYESKKPEDTAPILEKVAALEKRNAELESHIKYVDYTKSTEFVDKYQKPYQEAWTKATADFAQLNVRIPAGVDEATGEQKFTTRKATTDDLLALANMPIGEMDERAEQMFGKSAPRVIRHVEKIRELALAQDQALTKAQQEAGERSKLNEAQTKAQREKAVSLWNTANADLAAKYPKFYAPEEGDTEGNALLEKGFALADRLFIPTAETAPKTPEEQVKLHARIRNKVANHDRLAFRLNNANKRIAELEKTLAEFEKSEPKGGEHKAKAPVDNGAEDWEKEIEALDRD